MVRPAATVQFEAGLQRGGRGGDTDGQGHHHRRVAQREEEADRNRALALLHQLARYIVDGSDMVGIKGMPQPECVGQDTDADREHGVIAAKVIVLGGNQAEQDPEAEDVQEDDKTGHAPQRRPVLTG